MKYMRVKDDWAGQLIFGYRGKNGTYIGEKYKRGQLFTKTEFRKMRECGDPCEEVEIPKNKTYFWMV